MSKKVIATSLAVAVVIAAVWLAVHHRCTPRPPQKVLVVSKPRTVATLPAVTLSGPHVSLYWLDNDTLVLGYRFESWADKSESPFCIIHGILAVDARTGTARLVRTPQPVGGSPRTLHTWSRYDHNGQLASLQLPPIETGSDGTMSFEWPATSPVDDRIAYRVRVIGTDGKPGWKKPGAGLWISRIDGSEATRVVPWDGVPLEWSPDGRMLVFKSYGHWPTPGIWVCRADGSGVRRIADQLRSWAISPDGQRIAFVDYRASASPSGRKSSLCVMKFPRGRPKVVAEGARSPVWAGDSLLCVVGGRRTSFRFPFSSRKRILPPKDDVGPMWIDAIDLRTGDTNTIFAAPRGRRLWSIHAPPGRADIFVLHDDDITGGDQRYYVCTMGREGLQTVPLADDVDWSSSFPAWSPDGRRLAYIDESEINVVDVSLKRAKR